MGFANKNDTRRSIYRVDEVEPAGNMEGVENLGNQQEEPLNIADIQVVGRASAIGTGVPVTRNPIETHENERSENYQSAIRESFIQGDEIQEEITQSHQ